MPTGLYQTPDYVGRAQQAMGGAAGTFGGMQRKGPEDPGPSAGGAIQAGMGGASTGAAIGSIIPGVGTGIGAAVGGVLGIGAYLLS